MSAPKKPVSITFKTDAHKKDELDHIAEVMDRDRTYVLNEAVNNYLDLYHWQVKTIEEGLAQADRGEFVSEAEIQAEIARWKS